MKDYSFMAFAVCMGTLVLFVLGVAIYSAGFFWHWWR